MGDAQNGAGTVGKALGVLDQVARFGRPVRFVELLAVSPYPKATLYRLVQTLTQEGMLVFSAERQTYALGVRLVRLAHAAWEQSSLAPVARRHLETLSSDLGETVHLAQLDHASVLYVDKVTPLAAPQMFSQAGRVGPAYCTGVGKVMLAYLPAAQRARAVAQQSFHGFTPNTIRSAAALEAELEAIRIRGYGFDREEHEPGIICVALPILTSGGQMMGAMSITSSTDKVSLDALEAHVPTLRRAADQISEDAEQWRFPELVQS